MKKTISILTLALSIMFTSAQTLTVSVDKNPALMIVRPRGLHLDEAHLEIDGRPLSGSFVDFGLHIFNTGKTLAKKNMGPFYYIPKFP